VERSQWAGLAAVNAAAVIFGGVALSGGLGLSPAWIVAGRAGFAVLALGGLALSRGRGPSQSVTLLQALPSGLLLALHWVLFFASVQMAGVAVATLTMATFPLVTVILEAVRRRATPSTLDLAAGGVVIAAIGLVMAAGLPSRPLALAGGVAGLASAALFAVFALASQALALRAEPLRLSLMQNAVVVAVTVPALPFAGAAPGPEGWLALAALGVVGTALSHQLYLFGLRRLPAAVCGAVVSLEPIYAITFAAIALGQRITSAVALSAVLIVAASFILLRRRSAAPA
jgi:drug/metabolite transporter (DMT)-like permease